MYQIAPPNLDTMPYWGRLLIATAPHLTAYVNRSLNACQEVALPQKSWLCWSMDEITYHTQSMHAYIVCCVGVHSLYGSRCHQGLHGCVIIITTNSFYTSGLIQSTSLLLHTTGSPSAQTSVSSAPPCPASRACGSDASVRMFPGH